ncbi:hypothetical protein BCR37DRAFT_378792 [Protomyces lactucae-debilis]|uniref:Uncharacterized protein n=1 Tax=Protomyces lactucae-debilis TaxID=2754530 RepID=A0A1Y2FIN4_PROLT|nr:uncharacterized protein BCR37DRAFT_378792 [Protomyces lactucae-debilis]ORY83798.1 hypothetical protein BCR37DRAFT_378792 [Protomyces lactucae-debilis]
MAWRDVSGVPSCVSCLHIIVVVGPLLRSLCQALVVPRLGDLQILGTMLRDGHGNPIRLHPGKRREVAIKMKDCLP